MTENLFQPVTVQGGEPEQSIPAGRRSILQIRVDILRVVAQGFGKPTQIMYKANLSWNVLQAQLRSFVVAEMLTVEEYGSRRRYTITTRGADLVRSYEKVVNEILN
ncbi:MAG: winged helix-turn-helix domain-containing protein [Thaumarchaeota archaeon]|nr:winged helix-turn-helix domain-containing protein [Nitrososphaerota archaeon]